jgi:NarL family two-component system response regulator LiaR
MREKIQIIIAEDHALYRQALIKELLPYNIVCVGEAENGNQLLNILENKRECIVLLDLEMPEMSGKEALVVIRDKFPLVRVLITSQYDDQNVIDYFRIFGVYGYLPKNYISGDVRALANAILEIKHGKKHFVYRNDDKRYIKYTKRELELIPLICEGKTSKQIARELGIGEKAIEKHRSNLLEKSNTQNLASFIKYSVKRGLDFLGGKKG